MALSIEKNTREFKYNGQALPDPDPKLTVDAVKEFYAHHYPDITNAAIEGPERVGAKMVYEFRRAVGTKGGTKADPGRFDCYAAAADDEPMFVLLARDKHAPALIWLWATMREFDGEDPAKVKEARELAATMMVWAKAHDRKVCGLGTATLAGCMEFIRTINGLMKALDRKPDNEATSDELIRRYLCETEFDLSDGKPA